MDGYQVARRLREAGRWTQVLMLTAMDALGRGAEKADGRETLLSALLYDPQYKAVADDLRAVAHNFRDVSERVAQGQGLLGQLTRDGAELNRGLGETARHRAFESVARVVRLRIDRESLELTQYLTPEGRPFPPDYRASGVLLHVASPRLLLVIAGSLVAGPVLARLTLWITRKVRDVPTAIIIQFIFTFGVWIIADRLGLSSVLTMGSYAISVARRAPESMPARLRLPSYAVWDTAVFVLNVLAFVFIGLQIRPTLASLDPDMRTRYLSVAGAVLFTVIVARIVWVMTHNTVARWKIRRFGFHPRRPIRLSSGGRFFADSKNLSGRCIRHDSACRPLGSHRGRR